jgi:hypothetical protein
VLAAVFIRADPAFLLTVGAFGDWSALEVVDSGNFYVDDRSSHEPPVAVNGMRAVTRDKNRPIVK